MPYRDSSVVHDSTEILGHQGETVDQGDRVDEVGRNSNSTSRRSSHGAKRQNKIGPEKSSETRSSNEEIFRHSPHSPMPPQAAKSQDGVYNYRNPNTRDGTYTYDNPNTSSRDVIVGRLP